MSVELHWIPAHIRVEGNELTGRLAKEATGQKHNHPPITPTGGLHYTPKTAVKAIARSHIWREWTEEWTNAPHGAATRAVFVKSSSKALVIYCEVKCAVSSIIIQPTTMKVGLIDYLYKIGWAETKECHCGRGHQTRQHILPECS